MADPKTQQDVTSAIGAVEASDFDSLLKKEFKPKTDEAKEAVERAVRTLAEQALSQTKLVSSDVVKSIEAIIAQLDKKLTEQINGMLMQQRLKEAEAALTPLLRTDANDPEVLLMLGRLRFLDRKCQEAEEVFRRLLTIQPGSLNGLMQLSLAILCQQRWSDAVVPLRQIISLKPDFTQAHYNLGYALAQLGDSPGAIRSYRDALRSSPGDMAAHLALAEELFLSGQREDAFTQLNRAAELNPDDPRIPKLRERLQKQR